MINNLRRLRLVDRLGRGTWKVRRGIMWWNYVGVITAVDREIIPGGQGPQLSTKSHVGSCLKYSSKICLLVYQWIIFSAVLYRNVESIFPKISMMVFWLIAQFYLSMILSLIIFVSSQFIGKFGYLGKCVFIWLKLVWFHKYIDVL